jgi:hypothetical protein
MGYLYETCDQISDFCYQVAEKNILEERTDRQTEVKQYTPGRNLTGPKTLPIIWYTYMTLVTKYQISEINCY